MGLFGGDSEKNITNRTTITETTDIETVSGTKAGGDVAGIKAGGDVAQRGATQVRAGRDVGLTGSNFRDVAESLSRTFRQGVAQLSTAQVARQSNAEEAAQRAELMRAGTENANSAPPRYATATGDSPAAPALIITGLAAAAAVGLAYWYQRG